MRSFFARVEFLGFRFLFFVGLGFGGFVGGLGVADGAVVGLGDGFVVTAEFVFVAVDLLLGLQQLEVGRVGLRQFVVVLDFEFI